MSTSNGVLEPLLDLKTLAKILGIPAATLYTLRSRDPGSVPPAVKIGGALRWRPADVCAWRDDRVETPARESRPQLRPVRTRVRLPAPSTCGRKGRPARDDS